MDDGWMSGRVALDGIITYGTKGSSTLSIGNNHRDVLYYAYRTVPRAWCYMIVLIKLLYFLYSNDSSRKLYSSLIGYI